MGEPLARFHTMTKLKALQPTQTVDRHLATYLRDVCMLLRRYKTERARLQKTFRAELKHLHDELQQDLNNRTEW